MTNQLKNSKRYDVIVVGGGSSGLMAAINAAQQGVNVLVIDKNRKPGRKLLLSGGTRCNVTNRTTREDLIKHIPGNGKFLYSALNQFDQEDIVEFFESRGVELKEEDHGRMFPVTDKSQTILDALLKELEQHDVTFKLHDPVDKVLYDLDEKKVLGVKTKSGETFQAGSVILAVGGKAYPKTGTTGDGYKFAKAAGHTITQLYPTEVPLLSDDIYIKERTMQGVPLRDVNVTVWDENGKPIVEHNLDMIFTHFGYSGPAILRCSGHVNQYLERTHAPVCHLSIDLTPELSQETLKAQAENQRDKQVLTILKQWMPERMAELICTQVKIDPANPYKQMIHGQVDALMQYIKAFPITAHGSKPIEKGYVTGGGVATNEVNPKTMESKLMHGLYFCGELLDINGYTGGYNITSAFVTGTIAGRYAAWGSFG
ncbi:NAD(P)/FAD-dependent oxidoreductase [Atopococcus tabaci]|uniref:NAD(P)/FAD-dependent oxidoreductase n=1 Tax=Atopococcus tabaci TaxID=269774 RepID=UPI0004818919|nr:NAD(P)/FAD-dependent oxidoreductase [Atopococcus tabaci]